MSWLRRSDYNMSKRQFEQFKESEEYYDRLAHFGEQMEKEELQEDLVGFLKHIATEPVLGYIVDMYMEKYGHTLPDSDDLRWGSSQYDGAYEVFYTLKAFKDAGLDPIELIFPDEILESMPKPVLSVKESLKSAKRNQEERIKEYWDEELDGSIEEQWKDMNVETDENLDNLFVCLKNFAADLWSASSDVTEVVFGDEMSKKLHQIFKIDKIWGRVDPANGSTGFECYLLYAVGYISDVEEAFCGFST